MPKGSSEAIGLAGFPPCHPNGVKLGRMSATHSHQHFLGPAGDIEAPFREHHSHAQVLEATSPALEVYPNSVVPPSSLLRPNCKGTSRHLDDTCRSRAWSVRSSRSHTLSYIVWGLGTCFPGLLSTWLLGTSSPHTNPHHRVPSPHPPPCHPPPTSNEQHFVSWLPLLITGPQSPLETRVRMRRRVCAGKQ